MHTHFFETLIIQDTIMAEKAHHLHDEIADENIVRSKTSKSGIVLRPQPSNDPNDPLVRLFFYLFSDERDEKAH